jgi:hypothetical protein
VDLSISPWVGFFRRGDAMTTLNRLLNHLHQLKADPATGQLEDLITAVLVSALGVIALAALL